jgi:hypothetical protein
MRYLFVVLVTLGLFSCGDQDPGGPVENSIEIVSIDPAPNSKLDRASVISANLKYTIAPDENSDYGFKIWIQFTKPGDSTSYSFQPNSIDLDSYSGTVTLSHAIEKEWVYEDTRHPIQCHFTLLRRTSPTASKILAKTTKVDFTE